MSYMKSESSQVNVQAVQAGGQLNIFEKYLTLWIVICIAVDSAIGNFGRDSFQVLNNVENNKQCKYKKNKYA